MAEPTTPEAAAPEKKPEHPLGCRYGLIGGPPRFFSMRTSFIVLSALLLLGATGCQPFLPVRPPLLPELELSWARDDQRRAVEALPEKWPAPERERFQRTLDAYRTQCPDAPAR